MPNIYTRLKETEQWEHKIITRSLYHPIQPTLFETAHKGSVRMGLFFELLCTALFRGRLSDNGRREFCREFYYPDVSRGKLRVESKACRIGHHLLLMNRQCNSYLESERKGHTIWYAIFRHDYKGIKSFTGQTEELWQELAQRIKYCLIVPLSLIINLKDDVRFSKLYYVKTGGAADPQGVHRLSSIILHELFLHPESVFQELPDMIFRKSQHFRLKGISINDISVKEFPVTKIYTYPF